MSAIHPRVSVNLVSGQSWTLDQHIPFLHEHGYDTIGLTTRNLGEDWTGATRQLRDAGLKVEVIGSAFPSLIEDAATTLERLKPMIDVSADLNCPVAFAVAGPAPSRMPTSEACDRLVACLESTLDYARGKEVQFALEHASPGSRAMCFVNSLADACSVAADAGCGVVLELQNCWYDRDLPRLFRENVQRFSIVQCSDFVVGEPVQMNRRVPGDGDMPLEWMIGQLLDAGYTGMFDLEMIGPAIEKEGYASAITRGADWLSECLTRLGA